MSVVVDSTSLEALVNQIYDGLKMALNEQQNDKIDVNLILKLTMLCMQMVEKLPHLTGAQKKDIVIQVIVRLVDEIPKLSSSTRQTLQQFCQVALPGVIDALVSANDGQLALNVKQSCVSLWSCLTGKK